MKKTATILISLAIFLTLAMPAVSLAQDTSKGLIPCGRSGPDAPSNTTHPCEFKDVITLINTIITFIFKFLALPLAAIMFAYAGFLLVTAGGAEAKSKAKKIFTNAVIGLVIAAAAVIIVKTLLGIMQYKDVGTFL
jgi:amino acid transporter